MMEEREIIETNFDELHKSIKGASTRGVLWEKVFLEISQNSKENICQILFLNKVPGLSLQLY